MRQRLQRATLETWIWCFLLATIIIITAALAANWEDLMPSNDNPATSVTTSTLTLTSTAIRREVVNEYPTTEELADNAKCTGCKDKIRACIQVCHHSSSVQWLKERVFD
ncbi:uncharacterized protein K460DRAFT_404634 [Cucurbitaria berberidis CBS 394.84]|uniref:Uncharacterized protein n=1 Tax=Cucurbitaria berberidis CBS 394.84 TaxID=1168544 RepID=A0A9P4GQ88_9PLEO|nr:uncharacterized protein K460DRAFT_404634 [Cucurbitaria berberidis CBS 394.84]KAF1849406.1 hypothetical protein K460DRAFT_404634 [Cucurbitaria berberidis CBS 394.84]